MHTYKQRQMLSFLALAQCIDVDMSGASRQLTNAAIAIYTKASCIALHVFLM